MKYKILFSVLVILFACLLVSGTASARNIYTFDDLMAIHEDLNGNHTLMRNITFTQNNSDDFYPIGYFLDPFTGTFNGNGYTISNINYSDQATPEIGFFGYTSGANISNLTLKNVSMKGNLYTGGLIGRALNTKITNCSALNSDISGEGYVGGLVGYMWNSSAERCYTTNDVSGTVDLVGGFVGLLTYNSSVNDSYATGSVNGEEYVGGFAGLAEDSQILRCYTTSPVGFDKFIGGIRGTNIVSSFSSQAGNNLTGLTYWVTTDNDVRNATRSWNISEGVNLRNIWYTNSTILTDYPQLFWSYVSPVPTSLRFGSSSFLSGTTGTPYVASIIAESDTPVVWSVSSGSLPDGLALYTGSDVASITLMAATTTHSVAISGTPTKAGTYNFDIMATNDAGSTTQSFTITVDNAAPEISTKSLPAGVVWKDYSSALEVTGTPPITWSVASGSLPAGLTLGETTGIISGIPSATGEFDFIVQATNVAGCATQSLSITINSLPTITTESLPAGVVGIDYSQMLTATGTTPITWSLASGSLPAGLILDGATGVISGTPSTAEKFDFTIKATNAAGSITQELSITISDLPIISTKSLLTGVVGIDYSQTLVATGATPITWSLASGLLPAGLTLDETTGVISGTSSATGEFDFTVQAANTAGSATQPLSITVNALPEITTTSLFAGIVEKDYNQALAATGTTPITWSLSSGSLPAGLTLDETTGVILGTPSATGEFNFIVEAMNAAGGATQSLSITVNALPEITTISLFAGIVGIDYSQALAAIGTTPITWSLSSGSLPAGLTLDETTGLISGTPSATGNFDFTVQAANTAGSSTQSFSITVNALPEITTTSLFAGIVEKDYSQALAATGTTPITWSLSSGSLPEGLTLDETIGVISGTPSTTGEFDFTVQATNVAGSATQSLSITINALPEITTTSLFAGIVGKDYSQALAATGTIPITWSLSSGSLPEGLTLDETAGLISGTPSATGNFDFIVEATNAAGSATQSLSITVNALPTITTVSLPGGIIEKDYSQTLTSMGTSPIEWTIDLGLLPEGLELSSDGIISGTPSEIGPFTFTVKAVNIAGDDTKELSIEITVANSGGGSGTGGATVVNSSNNSTPSNVSSNGSSNVSSNGSSNVSSNGSSNVSSNESSNVSSNGPSNEFSNSFVNMWKKYIVEPFKRFFQWIFG